MKFWFYHRFTQSFDRTNLKYIVVPKKPKKVIQDIIALIKQSFSDLSGIVYCLSRRDCEIVAGELCKANIAGLCYHAGLSNEDRSTVQQRWVQGDRCKASGCSLVQQAAQFSGYTNSRLISFYWLWNAIISVSPTQLA